MRDDEEVKAELHQRVEDLKDRLWNICDNKKLDSEKEREAIMNNGWLQDKTGLLTNHYITLIQVSQYSSTILNSNLQKQIQSFCKVRNGSFSRYNSPLKRLLQSNAKSYARRIA